MLRFRLIAALGAVGVIACGLTLFRYCGRVPMSRGAMYLGNCYRSDLEKLSSSLILPNCGDFSLMIFEHRGPSDLFKGFSVQPQLSPATEIGENVGRHMVDQPNLLFAAWGRSRPIDCPVGGLPERLDLSDRVNDFFAVRGTFEESLMSPKRYFIDCAGVLNIGYRSREPTTVRAIVDSAKASSGTARTGEWQLRYAGPAPNGLFVFIRPIDDKLVQLVILDMRRGGTGESGREKGGRKSGHVGMSD